jgi:hypothetical protein
MVLAFMVSPWVLDEVCGYSYFCDLHQAVAPGGAGKDRSLTGGELLGGSEDEVFIAHQRHQIDGGVTGKHVQLT